MEYNSQGEDANCLAENTIKESLLQILQKGISETTEENLAFAKEISSLLIKLRLDLKSLPVDIKEGLQKVASLLKAKELSDLDYTTLAIVEENDIVEKRKRQREEKKLSFKSDFVVRKSTLLQRKLDQLQGAVDSIESLVAKSKQEEEDSYCDHALLTKKLTEYQQACTHLEEQLDNMQVEELYPDKILNKSNQYLELSGQLVELNRSLSQYDELPPNLFQAKRLLAEKQKELAELEQTFLGKSS